MLDKRRFFAPITRSHHESRIGYHSRNCMSKPLFALGQALRCPYPFTPTDLFKMLFCRFCLSTAR